MSAILPFHYDGYSRRVRVHVPVGVSTPAPLLVLFDGQNVLGDAGSYAGGWYADVATDALPKTVRRPLVVAVDHGGLARIHELWRGLAPFLAFVGHEVLPAVRARWETEPLTVIGGSSMGGLAAFAAHLRDPVTWNRALVMSPSLWVDEGALFREFERSPLPSPSRIYLDVGAREGGAMPMMAARLAETLNKRGYGPDTLMWRPDERGRHQERHWRRRLPKALRFLFRSGS